MKKIIFIRHAKAEDSSSQITDFERSLTIKGKIISKMMARKLGEKENSHGIIISSPAFRALETAIIFANELSIDPEKILIKSSLYFKMNFHSLIASLSDVNEDQDTVMLFGHNPSFSDIANNLCKEGCEILPKCGIIGISFKISTWSEVKHNAGNMDYLLKPQKII
jgi:phosphohistidine phosphatase